MDTAELIKLYKRPCIIFNDSAAVRIEDDEIIDLDSLSLDSNEDTWLLSNSKGNGCTELSKEELEKRLDNVSVDGSGDFSRISLTNWDFKEETLSESLLNYLNTTNMNHRKVEIDIVDNISPINPDDLVSTVMPNKIENLQKSNSLPSDYNTFKKPLPKDELIEKVDSQMSPAGFVGQEKNYPELNGTAKKKVSLNKSIPLHHSTPLPMLRRRLIRAENESISGQKSNDRGKTIDTGPFASSSASSTEDLNSTSEPAVVIESTDTDSVNDESLDITLKDEANATFEMHDDSKSTSSSDSRRSSSTSIPRTVLQSRGYSSPSSSSRRLELATTNVFSPPKNISTSPRSFYNSPRARSARKILCNESKIKETSRRAPSLNRIPAPSVDIHEEFVSVVEIKSKDNAPKMSEKKPPNAPASHIPRPSTRIPVFRTSSSCTRPASKK